MNEGKFIFDDVNFTKELLDTEIPVLVLFWAPWSNEAQSLRAIMDEVAEEYNGKVKVGECNLDENHATARRFRIMSVPVMKIFKGGKEEETIKGMVSKMDIKERLEEVLRSEGPHYRWSRIHRCKPCY
jgi:thioredoxin 1